jgi:hypothetical protein
VNFGVVFPESAFVPLALGFFGLATGYLIWGGSTLFGAREEAAGAGRSIGLWGIWMPGFLQFLTGIWLFTGLTWFDVFGNSPALYMAALAFTAYGVHWFVLGYKRYVGASSAGDGWMAIAYIVLSALGLVVFLSGAHRDVPVAILFAILTLVYLFEAPTRLGFLAERLGGRAVATIQLIGGIWLLYLTCAVTLNLATGRQLWV